MPDDIYGNKYVNKMYVKGAWYSYEAGPRPKTYTGSIESFSNNNIENIRNKALFIQAAQSGQGIFPEGKYGHNYAILTIRYGEGNDGLYIQKAVDLTETPALEYERVSNPNSTTGWSDWVRVSAYTDSSGTADEALRQAKAAAAEASYIDTFIGKTSGPVASNNTPLATRIKNNSDNIDGVNTALTNYKKVVDPQLDNLAKGSANDRVARDHTNKIINNDVRTGQLPGIKVYSNQNGFTIGGNNSVRILDETNMRDWGFNGSNSVFLVSNANNDINEAHVEGGTFVPPLPNQDRGGWYAVWTGSTNTDILLNWTLIVFNQSII